MKATDVIVVAAVAGLAYWLYKEKNKLTGPGSVFDTATSAVANLFPGTSPSVNVSSQLLVMMPDGSYFPANLLSNYKFATINGQAQFTFNNQLYALTPQVNGVYQAIAI